MEPGDGALLQGRRAALAIGDRPTRRLLYLSDRVGAILVANPTVANPTIRERQPNFTYYI